MGRLALPVALLLVLPLVASAARSEEADAARLATRGPPPRVTDPTVTDPTVFDPAAPPAGVTDASASRQDGLTLVLTFGLTDRLLVHSTTAVAWRPRPGGRGASFLANDSLEVSFRLGPRGVPWVPHVGIRLGAAIRGSAAAPPATAERCRGT